ncbi:MAG: ATP-binding protein [Desulfobacteraceae bacterium]|nr:MAG: ATP-binding protein [Desulfobacteraceae bacterium]
MKSIRLPARIENLENFTTFLSDFLNARGFPRERVQEIELAAEEALVNIIRYAYPEKPGDLEIRCRAGEDGALTMEFEDSGVDFDPTSLPDPDLTLSIAQREIGGLGVYLIRKMVNEVRHRREGERNILTFVVREKRGG